MRIFIATRSKRRALKQAKELGINFGIAVKVNGGFVVYAAY